MFLGTFPVPPAPPPCPPPVSYLPLPPSHRLQPPTLAFHLPRSGNTTVFTGLSPILLCCPVLQLWFALEEWGRGSPETSGRQWRGREGGGLLPSLTLKLVNGHRRRGQIRDAERPSSLPHAFLLGEASQRPSLLVASFPSVTFSSPRKNCFPRVQPTTPFGPSSSLQSFDKV